ncbi:MAG TPA: TetR/AcrR family transcriptional regulator [Chthoniobacterales bacterium]
MNKPSHTARPPSRRERERQRRLDDLLAAAEAVFAENGFENASMESIAAAAEYATGTLYIYFKNKEALYAAVFERKMQQLVATVCPVVDKLRDNPRAALGLLVKEHMAFAEAHRNFLQIYSRERMYLDADLKQGPWEAINGIKCEYIAFIGGLIADGQRRGVIRTGDTKQLAIALHGMIAMLTRHWLKGDGSVPLSTQAEFVTSLWLDGASAQ